MQVATLGDNVYQLTMCTNCEKLIYVKGGDLDLLSEVFQDHLAASVKCREFYDEKQKTQPTFEDITGIFKK